MTEIAQRLANQLSTELPDDLRPPVAAWLMSVTSTHTRRAYWLDIRDWLTFCSVKGVDPLTADKPHLDAWLMVQRVTPTRYGRPPSEATLARRVSTLASWYAYLRDAGKSTSVPVRGKNRPKMPKVSGTIGLSREEAIRFQEAADNEPLRNKAILATLLNEGVRVNELIELKVGSMRYNAGHWTFVIHGKGGTKREVPAASPVVLAVGMWLADRAAREGLDRDGLDAEALMFPADNGQPLNQPAIYRLVRRVARAAGIPSWRHLSPHSLRHTYATLSLDAGAAIRDVQFLLGHASHDTTVRYDRARGQFDNSPVYVLSGYLAAAVAE